MKPARLIVLFIAIAAGGIAALLAGRSDQAPPPPAPVAQIETAEVLVANAEIGMGHSIVPQDLRWQTWPAAAAGASYIRKSERPDAADRAGGLDCAGHVFRWRADPREQADPRRRRRLHGGHPAHRHARGLDRHLAGARRRRVRASQRSCRRHPDPPRQGRGGEQRRHRGAGQRDHPDQCAGAGDRQDGRGKERPDQRGRHDRDARADAERWPSGSRSRTSSARCRWRCAAWSIPGRKSRRRQGATIRSSCIAARSSNPSPAGPIAITAPAPAWPRAQPDAGAGAAARRSPRPSEDERSKPPSAQGIGNAVVDLIFSMAKREVTFLSGTAAIIFL